MFKKINDSFEKLEQENERLREALESVQNELITIRGRDKRHDGEITGLTIRIEKVLRGEYFE